MERSPRAKHPFEWGALFSILAVFLVLVGAAFLGPLVAAPTFELPAGSNILPSFDPPPEAPEPAESQPGAESDFSALPVLLVLVALATAAYLLIRYLLSHRRQGQERNDRRAYSRNEWDHPEVVRENLVRRLRAAAAELDGPMDSADAILKCWLELEDATRSAGVPRLSHQTTSEYTTHVLAAFDAPSADVSSLQTLYQRVRFGAHDGPVTVSDGEVARAREALESISASISQALPHRSAQ